MKAIDRERPSRAEVMTGLLRDRASAEQAYEMLRARGYGEQDINVLTTDDTSKKWYPTNDTNLSRTAGTNALEAAGVGGAIGSAMGALAALLAVASVAVPGVGLIAAGPIAALFGAGAGAATGGLVGALVGIGTPQDRAQLYDEGLKRGGMVIGVTPRSDEDARFFESEWRRS
jgi:hypothetical protein